MSTGSSVVVRGGTSLKMADAAKEEVMQLVHKLSELQLLEVCDTEDLKLSSTKKFTNRKSALRNLLIRHISSEEVEDAGDEGLALFTKLAAQMRDLVQEDWDDDIAAKEKEAEHQKAKQEMEEKLKELKTTVSSLGEVEDRARRMLGGGGSSLGGLGALAFGGNTSDINFESMIDKMVTDRMKSEMKSERRESFGAGGSGGGRREESATLGSGKFGQSGQEELNDEESRTATTTTAFHKLKLREFKIANGTVGVEGSLDYSDLVMQMKEGLSAGYSRKEVMSGVIRATKPGSELRKYLVRKSNLTYDDFKQTLREFYNVRESQSIMDEMRDMVQGENQDLLKYVMSMCALRDEAIEVAASEDCPPGEGLVKKRFVDSLLSGLRKPTVRLEMQAVLKLELADPRLFNEVNQIEKRVRENEKKVGVGMQSAEVKLVDVKKRPKRQEDEWRDETAAKLATLTAQVSKLEAAISALAGVNNAQPKPTDSAWETKMTALLGQVQHLTSQM